MVEERNETGKKKRKNQLTDQVFKLMGCYGSEIRHAFLLETASDTEWGGGGGHVVQVRPLRKTKVDPEETRSTQQMQRPEITY